MRMFRRADNDIPDLSATNLVVGAVGMWITGSFTVIHISIAHLCHGDIFAEQLGVTLSLTYDSIPRLLWSS